MLRKNYSIYFSMLIAIYSLPAFSNLQCSKLFYDVRTTSSIKFLIQQMKPIIAPADHLFYQSHSDTYYYSAWLRDIKTGRSGENYMGSVPIITKLFNLALLDGNLFLSKQLFSEKNMKTFESNWELFISELDSKETNFFQTSLDLFLPYFLNKKQACFFVLFLTKLYHFDHKSFISLIFNSSINSPFIVLQKLLSFLNWAIQQNVGLSFAFNQQGFSFRWGNNALTQGATLSNDLWIQFINLPKLHSPIMVFRGDAAPIGTDEDGMSGVYSYAASLKRSESPYVSYVTDPYIAIQQAINKSDRLQNIRTVPVISYILLTSFGSDGEMFYGKPDGFLFLNPKTQTFLKVFCQSPLTKMRGLKSDL